mmetsp:Transcript_33038/g.129768  ORF Transcript_33038/g.129768 Transcript_33038/m.129768 type:complete len:216 (-) Transcript_33038:741-1388(-)
MAENGLAFMALALPELGFLFLVIIFFIAFCTRADFLAFFFPVRLYVFHISFARLDELPSPVSLSDSSSLPPSSSFSSPSPLGFCSESRTNLAAIIITSGDGWNTALPMTFAVFSSHQICLLNSSMLRPTDLFTNATSAPSIVLYMNFCKDFTTASFRCFLLACCSDEMILAEIDLRSSLSRTERSWKSTGTILSIDIASFLYMMVVDLTSERLRS